MKFKELKEKTDKELMSLLNSHRNKLRELRFRVASKQLKNVNEIRQIRKEISQILTLLKEMKLGLGKIKQIDRDKKIGEEKTEKTNSEGSKTIRK